MAYILLTVSEVAQFLRLKTDSVYRFIQTAGLPEVKLGGQWRFEETRGHNRIANPFKSDPIRKASANLMPLPEPTALPTCRGQQHV